MLYGKWILCAKYKPICLIIFYCRRIHSWVRHANLNSFSYCFFNSNIMTKSLPLSINWVNTSPREDITLFNKPLPVNLVFVFLTRVSACNLKDLDKLTNCKSSSLALRSTMMVVMMIWMLLWSLGSDRVMRVIILLWRCIVFYVSQNVGLWCDHSKQLILIVCILVYWIN